MRAGTAGGAAASAISAALAAEQAAIYGYGVVGSHVTGTEAAAARAYWTAHQAAADKLTALLQAREAAVPPAAAAYQLPHAVRTPAQAASLAVTLEDQVLSAYLGLIAVDDEPLRALGARQARTAALRAAAWRGSTVAFPGLPDAALAQRS
jgi:Domain of unknown function (DUF4439)